MLDINRRCTYILCMMNNTIRPEEVYELVEAIPAGFVATYGQLAFLLERPRQSRMVGRALSHVPPGLSLPCHRVVNRAGRTAPGWTEQRALLEAEGIPFRRNGCVDLDRCLWNPFDDENSN